MSLNKYKQKRDFAQTAEPAGNLEISPQFRFVIQKHAASHLHYDFRIEHGGVLKSWAIPKGPPYTNAEKHLAMMVEDHPVEYAKFEGIIPEGNYGAGEVIVWDEGNYWVPHASNAEEVAQKISAGIANGEIKLILNGKKVKGLFALVKFKKAGENAWLMIKDNDEYEGINFFKDDSSVISHVALAGLDQAFIAPMLATRRSDAFNDPAYIFEEKYDGYRIIASKGNLYSRKGEIMNAKFPQIAKAIQLLKVPCVLDGEIVAYKKGVPSFQLLQNAHKADRLTYHVFDVLRIGDTDTTKLPLSARKKLLGKIWLPRNMKRVSFIANFGKKLLKKLAGKSEGIMAKKIDSLYTPGKRTSDWQKIKLYERQQFIIGGLTLPQNGKDGFGSLIVGYRRGKDLLYCGHVGSGFSAKLSADLLTALKKISRKSSPFSNYSADANLQFWCEPHLICDVSFAGWSDDLMIRQASFMGLIANKKPAEVTGDFVISNPAKIYWPEKKYTKLDLIEYYSQVAPLILPYLKDRPQNLNRHPDGIYGQSFYQKDIEFELPDFVHTIDIARDTPKQQAKESDSHITYLLCQNKETLLYMANLGCIEINPWLSRTISLDSPDYLVFDIDPNDVAWADVVKICRNLYEFLAEIGVHSVIKTSGKRGLHIYSKLKSGYQFSDTRAFAELVAKLFSFKYPKLVSTERSPSDRKGKIYIDYLQNRRGQTTAAVYSARPTPDATVSMPLKLTELTAKLAPNKLTIKSALKRIDRLGDIWAELKPVNLKHALKSVSSFAKVLTS